MREEKIHLVFGERSKSVLLKSKELAIPEDSIVVLNDDLTIGPIAKLDQPEGILERKQWLKKNIPCLEETSLSDDNIHKDFEAIQYLKSQIERYEKIYLWFGNISGERLYKARLISELVQWSDKLVLMEIPDIKIKSKFGAEYAPVSLAIMSPEEIPLITKYLKEITPKESKVWEDMWSSLISDDGWLRMSEIDGTIKTMDVSALDQALLENCKDEFQKSARIIGTTLVAIDFEIGDHTLNWRLTELAKNKKLEYKGALNCMRQYEVKKRK